MKTLKVIQFAAHRGNIGDNANIIGTRRELNKNLDYNIEYAYLKYLEYEPNPQCDGKKFEDCFLNLVNSHELFLIGGRGFFELAVDNSSNGTPLDIKI